MCGDFKFDRMQKVRLSLITLSLVLIPWADAVKSQALCKAMTEHDINSRLSVILASSKERKIDVQNKENEASGHQTEEAAMNVADTVSSSPMI